MAYCEEGKYCYTATTTNPTTVTEGCLQEDLNVDFSSLGTRVYNSLFTHESFFATLPSDPGYSGISDVLTNSFWSSNFNNTQGPLNYSGVRFLSDCSTYAPYSGEGVVPFYYYNDNEPRQIYIGFAMRIIPPNGSILIEHNGVILTQIDINNNPLSNAHQFWHVIPVILDSCDNYFNFRIGNNGDVALWDTFGIIIYDNTYNEIINATGISDLNVLFNTKNYIPENKKNGPISIITCPNDFMVSGNSVCIKMEYESCQCTCCSTYLVSRTGNNNNNSFYFYDCENEVVAIAPSDFPQSNTNSFKEICACKIITPLTQISEDDFIGDGFRVKLITECDPNCVINDGPPPTPTPEPTCEECGFTMISIGSKHTVGISGGTLFSWGSNNEGELGIGTIGGIKATPVQMIDPTGVSNWEYVFAGENCTFAINALGNLFACGLSTTDVPNSDQLGLGNVNTNYDTLTKVTVPVSTGWKKVWSKAKATIALQNDGTIFGTGINNYGQLGLNSSPSVFTQIGIDTDWIDISRGYAHTIGLKSTKRVYAWGTNVAGILNDPLGIGGNSFNVTRTIPELIPTLSFDIEKIAAGTFHSLALDSFGKIWGWGSNNDGQLDCEGCFNVDFSLPFQLNGKMTTGDMAGSSTGQVTNKSFIDIKAAGNSSFGITKDIVLDFIPFTTMEGVNYYPNLSGKRLWMWGKTILNKTKFLIEDVSLPLKNKDNWCNLWVGGVSDHTKEGNENLVFFAKDEIGHVRTWGSNSFKQLGIGFIPVCGNCAGNDVAPIGTYFNFNLDNGECENNDCDCINYTITNSSNYPLYCEYINCFGIRTDLVVEGGGIGNSRSINICACKDSLIVKDKAIESLISIIIGRTCS